MADQDNRMGAGGFVVGGLSFIPLIGVLFGIVAIVWGLASGRRGGKAVAVIGALGVAFTITLYGSLIYFGFVQRGGVYDDLRAQLSQRLVNDLVPVIETYRLQHDAYPESLAELQKAQPAGSALFITDGASKPLFYERVGEAHYYLRGVGADGVPFTVDDVVPSMDRASAGKLGLLFERQAAAPTLSADAAARMLADIRSQARGAGAPTFDLECPPVELTACRQRLAALDPARLQAAQTAPCPPAPQPEKRAASCWVLGVQEPSLGPDGTLFVSVQTRPSANGEIVIERVGVHWDILRAKM